MTRIVLHAGMHKTGTSSIQYALDGSKELLSKEGWHYIFLPRDARRAYNYIHKGIGDADQASEELLKLFSSSNKDNLVVSSEDMTAALQPNSLWKEKGNRVNYIFKVFEKVEFVIYFRRQDSFYESAFQQRAKGGVPLNFKETMRKLPITESMDWFEKFKTFEKSFSNAEFHYLCYEKACECRGIVESFFDYIGLSEAVFIKHKKRNASSKILTKILAEYGPLLPSKDLELLSGIFSELEKNVDVSNYNLLSPGDRINIFNTYFNSNKRLYELSENTSVMDLNAWRDYLLQNKCNSSFVKIGDKEMVTDLLRMIILLDGR